MLKRRIGCSQRRVNNILSSSYDVFAVTEDRFRNSEFHIQTEAINVRDKEFTHEIGIIFARFLAYSKKKGSEDVTVNLVIDKDIAQQIDPDFVRVPLTLLSPTLFFTILFPFLLFLQPNAPVLLFFAENSILMGTAGLRE